MTTFKQLDAFVALADAGTFEKAAQCLKTVQSAVSRHVSEFELDFEHGLLDRSGRRALLTVDGADVLILCRSILQQRDAMLRALQKQSPPVQTLRVGVTQVTVFTWFHRFLDAMGKEYPQIAVEAHVEQSMDLYDLLESESLDFIVVPDTTSMDGVAKVWMGGVESHWYCSPKIHPGPTALSVKDLAKYTLLTKGSRAYSGILLDEWLRYNSIEPRFTISSNSLFALLDLLVSGIGISYLPAAFVTDLLAENRILEVTVRPRMQPVNYVVLMRKDSITGLRRNVIALAQAACDFNTRYKGAFSTDASPIYRDAQDA